VHTRLTRVLVVAIHLLGGIAAATDRPHTDSIAVVVGAKSEIAEVTLDTLRELYLRRRRVWPDGSRVIPVNLPVDSDTRRRFSKRVLGRLPQDLSGYWDRMYFDGIQPPVVLRTSEAVCAYLAVEPKAIGYVRLDEVDRNGCHVLFVLPE
jgi:ABC-type phosphate transport system substrate-binding protein